MPFSKVCLRCTLVAAVLLWLHPPQLRAQDNAGRTRNPEQLQELLKRFPKADLNGDGTLSLKEAQQFRRARNQNPTKPEESKIAPTHSDVAYGPHERNVLDLYLAKSSSPTPLIVYIHGGGFVGGNKRSINSLMVRSALENGISVAALHYRFVNGKDVIFPTPQRDCARAIQFLRSEAEKWNINKPLIACYGGSAGAGTSMWIAFHDDLAAPQSDDPVERESTRIVAVGTFGGQGTYDPIKIKGLIGGRAWEHRSLQLAYGLPSTQAALSPPPELQQRYSESSAITHLTQDDPPLFMVYSEPDIEPPADSKPGQFIHHPNFGKQLQQEMNQLGIENIYLHTAQVQKRNPTLEMFEFFQKHFDAAK